MEYFCVMNGKKELELRDGVRPMFKLFRKINLNHDITRHDSELQMKYYVDEKIAVQQKVKQEILMEGKKKFVNSIKPDSATEFFDTGVSLEANSTGKVRHDFEVKLMR